MQPQNPSAYGLWSLVAINSAVFIMFAFSFFKPRTGRDWRSFGAFSAFLVALFAEMYGYPLTIYLLSGWLQSRFPEVDWFSHDAGHLLEMIFGWRANPHFGVFHILSYLFIGGASSSSPAPGEPSTKRSEGDGWQRAGPTRTSATRNMPVSSSSCSAFSCSGRRC